MTRDVGCRPSRRTLLAALPALALPAVAHAQVATSAGWPSRNVRFVVPFAPGGPVEVPARFIADHLSQRFGKPVIVEARPGAGGALGIQAVLAARDEHSFVFTTGSVAIVPALRSNPGYDPFEDLVPVTLVSEVPLAILARPDSRVKSLQELLTQAKAEPGKITYGSSGIGATTHLAGELLKVRAGIDLLHVPYRGVAQAVNALYAGDTDLMVTGLIEGVTHIRDGRLLGIGVTSPQRSPVVPDVPAIAEAVPGYGMVIWYAILAPRGTPQEVVDLLAREVAPLAQGSVLAQRLQDSGGRLLLDGPAPLAARLREEVPMWREVVQRAGITAN
ncbi:MAG TPA: tripartite tricarboxylate transporter substrate-binding protein [Falsiroseomonas sp.]|nr:tripartite tricarboxylate transporter substrate-binding protein [Falsiroseomonas sp.]